MFGFVICVFFFLYTNEESVLTKKIKKKKKKNWFVFMFGFVICVSEFVAVIFGCKIDFLFFLMIGSYWAPAFD